MNKTAFAVHITETLSRTIIVYADDADIAYETAEELCNTGRVELGDADFDGRDCFVSRASQELLNGCDAAFDADDIHSENERDEDSEYFGVTRWHRDDIWAALTDRGYDATDDAVDLIYNACKNNKFFTDPAIEAGWEVIHSIISLNAENLRELEVQ